MSDSPPPSPPLPGDGEPDESVSPEGMPANIEFAVTVNRSAINTFIEGQGLVPTTELRLTIARELHQYVALWIEDTIAQVTTRIKFAN